MKNTFFVTVILAFVALSACQSEQKNKDYLKGSYGFDVRFFQNQKIEMVELKDSSTEAAVLVAPAFQGRVMTSTAEGMSGYSFGWINHEYIRAAKFNDQFNPFGGEERLWFGPEGGKFSIYFDSGVEQSFENWRVPKELDTMPFHLVKNNGRELIFETAFSLENASGTHLEIGVERRISLLDKKAVENVLNIPIDASLKLVAYESENTLSNLGHNNWTKDTGFLSIWLLGMFNPSEKGVVFLPYKRGDVDELGKIVEDNYFAKVPSDRLIVKDGMIFFKVDGMLRGKIGLSAQRSLPFCGSYDPVHSTLTILWYSKPAEEHAYVNSKWGEQDDPLKGEVLNAYNDGPLADGSIMGPFYEIESSSPAALLASGESVSHKQRIFHITGEKDKLNEMTNQLFNISTKELEAAFN